MIAEAEQSHDLPSTSRRPGNTCGEVPVQTRRPQNQGSQWCKIQPEVKGPRIRSAGVQGQDRDVPAQAGIKSTLSLPFCSI